MGNSLCCLMRSRTSVDCSSVSFVVAGVLDTTYCGPQLVGLAYEAPHQASIALALGRREPSQCL